MSVIGSARTIEALDETALTRSGASGSFHPVRWSFQSAGISRRWRRRSRTGSGRLDALFGNGGILGSKARLGPCPRRISAPRSRSTLPRPIACSICCTTLLVRSEAARILFVTSGVAWKRHAGWTNYAIAKSAIEAMIGVYANEIVGSTMRANASAPADPDRMRVEPGRTRRPATVPPPEDLAPFIADLLDPKTTESGANLRFQTRPLHARPHSD